MATIQRLTSGERVVEGILIRPDDDFEFGPIAPFLLEVMLDESQTFTSKVTKHPVEDGSQISDHIIKQNKKFKVEVSISDATFITGRRDVDLQVPNTGVADFVLDNLGFVRQFLPPPVKPIVFSDVPRFAAIEARRVLQLMYDNRELLTLRTSIGDIDNVVITNFQTSRNATKSNRVFEFSLSMEQIQLVDRAATINFVERAPAVKDESSGLKTVGADGKIAIDDTSAFLTIVQGGADLVLGR